MVLFSYVSFKDFDDVYGVVTLAESLQEFTHFI